MAATLVKNRYALDEKYRMEQRKRSNKNYHSRKQLIQTVDLPPNTKICVMCDTLKPLDEFHHYVNHGKKRAFSYCKPCSNKRRKDDRKNNPEKTRLSYRNSSLKSLYGITTDEYDILLEKQNGVCAGCGRIRGTDGRRLHVDHHHDTGVIRGLLCNMCNRAIGMVSDNPEILKNLYTYLSKDFSL